MNLKSIFISVMMAFLLFAPSAKGQTESTDNFTWDNANVYFVMTDRFYNGNTSNDDAYGRGLDGNGDAYTDGEDMGEFHGGDLKGLTIKLQDGYFDNIGTNAIWITSPVEQMHGWCGGGSDGSFRHYGYHGYYALDWSELDDAMGTEDELMEFVDEAHSRGIRVIFDIVINHTGYATMHDMEEFGYGNLSSDWKGWSPGDGETWHSYHEKFIDYTSGDWTTNYWGTDWIRHPDITEYDAGGGDDKTMCVGFLPDLKTENTSEVDIPGILKAKWTAEGNLTEKQSELDTYFETSGESRTVINYMIFWISEWVRKYGIDGFRIDTAKHLEGEALKKLKERCVAALAEWKANNPDKAINDDEFWMTGEVWGHGFSKSVYHTDYGFNSVINFSLQSNELNRDDLESLFSQYAVVNDDDSWNGLSYLSSHDTELYDRSRLKEIAPGFLLLPGGIQTYYGDECARPLGSYSDAEQNTRSDMQWDNLDEETLAVWSILGQFRRDHPSIGAGYHTMLNAADPYVFAREYTNPNNGLEDQVIVAINASGSTTIDVDDRFPEGHTIKDYYTGTTSTVTDGSVTFTPDDEGILLLWDTDYVYVNKPIVSFVTTTEWALDAYDIELSIKDMEDSDPVLYYTFNTELSTDNLDEWNIYTEPFLLESTETIRIVGINSEGNLSKVLSKKYQVGPLEPMKIWFYKPDAWSDAYIYFWEALPEDLAPTSEAWPGQLMPDEGNNWYSYTLTATYTNIIFNGGSNTQQTDDLERSGTGWYRDGAWYDECPGDCPDASAPEIIITSGDKDASGLYSIYISGIDADEIYYTTDGDDPDASSTVYSGSFKVLPSSTVKAIGYNDAGASEIETWEIEDEENNLTIMCKVDAGTPTLYYWNVDGETNNPVSWPGVTMSASDEFDGWYEYTIEGNSTNIIFSNSGSGQTADLTEISDADCNTSDNKVWWDGSAWIDNNCDAIPTHMVYFVANGGSGTMTALEIEENTTLSVPTCTFSNNYEFAYWATCEDGSGDLYWEDDEIEMASSDIYLFAQWGTSTGIEYGQLTKLKLYPNPAKDIIYIKGCKEGSQFDIYNQVGIKVKSELYNTSGIHISDLSSGLYLVKVNGLVLKLVIN